MEVVNVRFDKKVLEKIDYAIKKGVYKSRSDALRKIVEGYLDSHGELFVEDDLSRRMRLDIEEDELELICMRILTGKETAAELVKEGRGI